MCRIEPGAGHGTRAAGTRRGEAGAGDLAAGHGCVPPWSTPGSDCLGRSAPGEVASALLAAVGATRCGAVTGRSCGGENNVSAAAAQRRHFDFLVEYRDKRPPGSHGHATGSTFDSLSEKNVDCTAPEPSQRNLLPGRPGGRSAGPGGGHRPGPGVARVPVRPEHAVSAPDDESRRCRSALNAAAAAPGPRGPHDRPHGAP